MQLLLLFLLLPTIVWGHGRLTVPLPRQCAGDNKPCFNKKAGEFFDPDAPINCGECGGGHPPNDPTKHVTKQSFVCRISEQDMMKTPPKQLTAGGTVAMRWVFPAAHPGDGGLYVSYDHNPNVDIRQSMKFFKIANFPQVPLLPSCHYTVTLSRCYAVTLCWHIAVLSRCSAVTL